jgi:creatinine amidohydrolase
VTTGRWGDATWREIEALPREHAVAILPLGAVEAHGPHLPLVTDGVIADAMAVDGAVRLDAAGWTTRVLPGLPYTAAPFAAGFAGTVSIAPRLVTELVTAIGRALAGRVACLALANAHLDPTHLASLHAAVEELSGLDGLQVAFPDLTRKPWAQRLGEEFRTGACHAGRYETSLVMARHPELVREELRHHLPGNPASLSAAIRAGKHTFEEAGGPDAYFGWPAEASVDEGRELVEVLGGILAEAVVGVMGQPP